jgi:thioester reductase-like protein
MTSAAAQEAIVPCEFPLSYPQLRLWFLEQLAPGDPAYHLPMTLHLTGPLDIGALDRAFQAIVDRHEILRTTFRPTDGEPVQVLWEHLSIHTTVADFSGLIDPGGRLADAARDVIRRPFDLTAAPLLRVVLARIGPLEHALIVSVHHIACDGWSVGVLAAELSELYGAAIAGREPALPELAVQYGDFAVWQREYLTGDAVGGVLAYWEQALAGAPRTLDLPADRSRLLVTTNGGARISRAVTPDLTARIDRLSAGHGVSRFMVVLAAYAAALGALAGASDVVIGTPTAGRARPEVRALIGCFIDMLPLRIDLSQDPAAADLLACVRATCLAAFAHAELPFERLVERLQPTRGLPRTPLFQVMLTFQDTAADALDLPGLSITSPGLDQSAAKYDMTLNVEQPRGGLLLELEFNRDLFDPATAGLVIDGVTAALSWLASADGTGLAAAGLPGPPARPGSGVLIRGYRITPGELRACLLRHPAVADCAVITRGETFAAYLVSSQPRPPGHLVTLLRAELPDYLVPEATTELASIPRTPDGAVYIAALPAPVRIPAAARAARTEPADELETHVLDRFRRALRMPSAGMADDFFEHGGSSLRALRLVAEIERDLAAELSMRQFFRAPTPHGVVAALRGQPAGAAAATLRQDEVLAPDIIPSPPHPLAWRPAHVLLTGATGFLGHALLERLLDEPGTVVTCLVRARDDDEAAARLRAATRRFGSAVQVGDRVRAVAGDLGQPQLGLLAPRYQELAADVAAVYHCAAIVSFGAPYPALRDANVTGTEQVIRFAATGTGKAVHYLSTLGQAGTAGDALLERLQPISPDVASGYIASKRVAEALVAQAGERGLPVTIVRLGLITAHRRTGAMGEHDQLALGLQTALRLGILPDLPDLPLHVMPVDQAADAIVALGLRPAAAGHVIHLYNPELARLRDVAALLASLGHPVRWVQAEQWAQTLIASGLPPAVQLLVRLFAEAPERSEPSVQARAAACLLGRAPRFSGLTAGYLERAVTFVLTHPTIEGAHGTTS